MKFLFWFYSGLILSLISCNSNSGLSNKEIKSVPNAFKPLNEERADYWLQLQMAYAEKRENGLVFYASGDFWSLSIDEDNAIHFRCDTLGIHYDATGATGIEPQDLNAIIYNVVSESGWLSVRLTPDSCIDAVGHKMPYDVNISFKNGDGEISSFEGCGLYLNNPVLHDIWALRSWNRFSDSLDSPGFPGNPYVEINLRTNRIMGNLGCGEVSGYISPKGNVLKIYGLDYLKKLSVCDSILAQDLFNYLNFRDHNINVDGLNLYFTSASDTLIFRKVD